MVSTVLHSHTQCLLLIISRSPGQAEGDWGVGIMLQANGSVKLSCNSPSIALGPRIRAAPRSPPDPGAGSSTSTPVRFQCPLIGSPCTPFTGTGNYPVTHLPGA